jgi:hypothetical protein
MRDDCGEARVAVWWAAVTPVPVTVGSVGLARLEARLLDHARRQPAAESHLEDVTAEDVTAGCVAPDLA